MVSWLTVWSLTSLSVRLYGVQRTERVAAAGDVAVAPELRAGQLQHLPEDRVSPELARQRK